LKTAIRNFEISHGLEAQNTTYKDAFHGIFIGNVLNAIVPNWTWTYDVTFVDQNIATVIRKPKRRIDMKRFFPIGSQLERYAEVEFQKKSLEMMLKKLFNATITNWNLSCVVEKTKRALCLKYPYHPNEFWSTRIIRIIRYDFIEFVGFCNDLDPLPQDVLYPDECNIYFFTSFLETEDISSSVSGYRQKIYQAPLNFSSSNDYFFCLQQKIMAISEIRHFAVDLLGFPASTFQTILAPFATAPFSTDAMPPEKRSNFFFRLPQPVKIPKRFLWKKEEVSENMLLSIPCHDSFFFLGHWFIKLANVCNSVILLMPLCDPYEIESLKEKITEIEIIRHVVFFNNSVNGKFIVFHHGPRYEEIHLTMELAACILVKKFSFHPKWTCSIDKIFFVEPPPQFIKKMSTRCSGGKFSVNHQVLQEVLNLVEAASSGD
jgi:hypothetical protein